MGGFVFKTEDNNDMTIIFSFDDNDDNKITIKYNNTGRFTQTTSSGTLYVFGGGVDGVAGVVFTDYSKICRRGYYLYQNMICQKIPDGKILVNDDGGIPTFQDCPNADLGIYSIDPNNGPKCNNYYQHGECQTACCNQQLIHCSFACFGFGSCISQCMSDRGCKYPTS